MADLIKAQMPGVWTDVTPAPITLIFPSGTAYAVDAGDYTVSDGGSILAKALGPGERWITVHPNGRDATKVLVSF